MAKALRVEAGTLLVADYRANVLITGPLDVDGLLWPYRWVVPRVEAVHHAFRAWEAERMGEVTRSRRRRAGRLPSEVERRGRRLLLGRIRVVEHEALEASASAVEVGADPAWVDWSRWSWRRGELMGRGGRLRGSRRGRGSPGGGRVGGRDSGAEPSARGGPVIAAHKAGA